MIMHRPICLFSVQAVISSYTIIAIAS